MTTIEKCTTTSQIENLGTLRKQNQRSLFWRQSVYQTQTISSMFILPINNTNHTGIKFCSSGRLVALHVRIKALFIPFTLHVLFNLIIVRPALEINAC